MTKKKEKLIFTNACLKSNPELDPEVKVKSEPEKNNSGSTTLTQF
jgi:hypothetical protein